MIGFYLSFISPALRGQMLTNKYQNPLVSYLPQDCSKHEFFGSFPTFIQFYWSSSLNLLKLQSSDLTAVLVRRKIKEEKAWTSLGSNFAATPWFKLLFSSCRRWMQLRGLDEKKLAKAVGRWTWAIQPHATTHKSSHPSDLKLTLVRWYSILRSLHCEETDQLIQQDYALNKLISMVMITCFLRSSNPLFFYTLFLLLTCTFK